MRAERILQKSVKVIYKTDRQSIAKCILQNGETKYVDLDIRKQVSIMSIDLGKAGEEDTEKLITGNFHGVISRSSVETAEGFLSKDDNKKEPGVKMQENKPTNPTEFPPEGMRFTQSSKDVIVPIETEVEEDKPKKRQTKKTK